MASLYEYAFQPINSTAPGFSTTSTETSIAIALESTAVNRVWQFPTSRVVRIASKAADDFFINFGSSSVSVALDTGVLILGGTAELFRVTPVQTHIIYASSTEVTFNVTLGTGR